jgi:DNA polymerase-1
MIDPKKKTALLIDSNNILAMCVHTGQHLTSPKTGEPTGGLYGFVRRVRALITHEIEGAQIHEVYAVQDSKPPAFRFELVPAYKNNRGKRTGKADPRRDNFIDAYRHQRKLLPDLISPLGVKVAKAENFEADDLIAGMVRSDLAARYIIVSADKDLRQLIDGKRVRLWQPTQHEWVEQPARGYRLYRAITGDPSDCIPRVPGLGEKRAQEIVDELLAEGVKVTPSSLKDNYKGRYKDKLKGFYKKVAANWQVMDLNRTADDAYKAMKVVAAYKPRLFFEKCREYGFSSIMNNPTSWIEPFKYMREP